MDSVLAFIDSINAFLAGLGDSLSNLILPVGTMVPYCPAGAGRDGGSPLRLIAD